jgi:hypothetical protein
MIIDCLTKGTNVLPGVHQDETEVNLCRLKTRDVEARKVRGFAGHRIASILDVFISDDAGSRAWPDGRDVGSLKRPYKAAQATTLSLLRTCPGKGYGFGSSGFLCCGLNNRLYMICDMIRSPLLNQNE